MDAGVGFAAEDAFPEEDDSNGDFLVANGCPGDLADFGAAGFVSELTDLAVAVDFDDIAALESAAIALPNGFSGDLDFVDSVVLAESAFIDFAFARASSVEIFSTFFDCAATLAFGNVVTFLPTFDDLPAVRASTGWGLADDFFCLFRIAVAELSFFIARQSNLPDTFVVSA